MATINSNIAMGVAPVQLTDPMTLYAKGLQVQTNAQQNQLQQMQLEKGQLDFQHEKTLADLYRKAINPDGSINREKVLQGAANTGLGARIPALQKSFLEADKAGADLGKVKTDTAKTQIEILHQGLQLTDQSINSLLQDPQVNENKVMAEMGRLVSSGAFNAQAAHIGKTPDQFAKDLVSTMPVGNPQALRGWLTQAGLRVMDSSKRMETLLPKYDEQKRGATVNQGTINNLTGERVAGAGADQNIALTSTPGESLQAQTTRRGQDITDNRARETNDIQREALQSQIVETPQGYQVVNKGTTLARPVANINGQPVLTKDSSTMKNAQMAQRLTGMIPYAKQLLTGADPMGQRVGDSATSSGTGALIDKLNNFTGISTKSGDAAAALETVSGWMTSNVPRFEGPQSDKDTGTYQIMAGIVGDRSKPQSTRLKALEAVETLMQQYKVDQTTGAMTYAGPPGTQPATRVAPPIAPGTGPTLAAPRGSSPMRRNAPTAVSTQAPDINSFFRN